MIVVSPDQTHLLFDEKAVIDRHQFYIIATFGFFVDENQNKPSFQRYTGYLNFINYPISHVLLLILVHVLLPSYLYFWLLDSTRLKTMLQKYTIIY